MSERNTRPWPTPRRALAFRGGLGAAHQDRRRAVVFLNYIRHLQGNELAPAKQRVVGGGEHRAVARVDEGRLGRSERASPLRAPSASLPAPCGARARDASRAGKRSTGFVRFIVVSSGGNECAPAPPRGGRAGSGRLGRRRIGRIKRRLPWMREYRCGRCRVRHRCESRRIARIAVEVTRFRADRHERMSARRRRPKGTGGEAQPGCGCAGGRSQDRAGDGEAGGWVRGGWSGGARGRSIPSVLRAARWVRIFSMSLGVSICRHIPHSVRCRCGRRA